MVAVRCVACVALGWHVPGDAVAHIETIAVLQSNLQMEDNKKEQLSRQLCRLLRHQGPLLGVPVNHHGFALIADVRRTLGWTIEAIHEVVESSYKDGEPRFQLRSDVHGRTIIRATRKHSLNNVALNGAPEKVMHPPPGSLCLPHQQLVDDRRLPPPPPPPPPPPSPPPLQISSNPQGVPPPPVGTPPPMWAIPRTGQTQPEPVESSPSDFIVWPCVGAGVPPLSAGGLRPSREAAPKSQKHSDVIDSGAGTFPPTLKPPPKSPAENCVDSDSQIPADLWDLKLLCQRVHRLEQEMQRSAAQVESPPTPSLSSRFWPTGRDVRSKIAKPPAGIQCAAVTPDHSFHGSQGFGSSYVHSDAAWSQSSHRSDENTLTDASEDASTVVYAERARSSTMPGAAIDASQPVHQAYASTQEASRAWVQKASTGKAGLLLKAALTPLGTGRDA